MSNSPKLNLCLAFSINLFASSAFASVAVDWVVIGNVGNAAQSSANRTHGAAGAMVGDGVGSVAHTYRIARNETTIADYVQFLNATAASDPFGLYNPAMSQDVVTSGISRNGNDGSYTYTAIGSAARPIAYVGWYDAARFANWLHHDQPSGPLAVGLIENGAYTLNGATSGVILKNADARVWIPTENEWYKAAYYDPTHMNGAGGYWLHANQSNTMVSNSPSDPGAANFYDGDFAVTLNSNITSQNHLTDVGAYGPDSASFYGINDMGGNLWEWNDLIARDSNGVETGFRGIFGGAWFNTADGIDSTQLFSASPDSEADWTIRLASIPEPTSALLFALAGCIATFRRKR